MFNREKYELIRASLLTRPCDRCEQAVRDKTHPDHSMRCDECNSSLKQRWQTQEKVRKQQEAARAATANIPST